MSTKDELLRKYNALTDDKVGRFTGAFDLNADPRRRAGAWDVMRKMIAAGATVDSLIEMAGETGKLSWPGSFGQSPWETAYGLGLALRAERDGDVPSSPVVAAEKQRMCAMFRHAVSGGEPQAAVSIPYYHRQKSVPLTNHAIDGVIKWGHQGEPAGVIELPTDRARLIGPLARHHEGHGWGARPVIATLNTMDTNCALVTLQPGSPQEKSFGVGAVLGASLGRDMMLDQTPTIVRVTQDAIAYRQSRKDIWYSPTIKHLVEVTQERENKWFEIYDHYKQQLGVKAFEVIVHPEYGPLLFEEYVGLFSPGDLEIISGPSPDQRFSLSNAWDAARSEAFQREQDLREAGMSDEPSVDEAEADRLSGMFSA